MLRHFARGVEVERHTGIAGTLSVIAAPDSIAAQQQGATLSVQGVVEFSEEEARQTSCSSVNPVDTEQGEIACTCERRDGSTCTWVAEKQGENCCIAREAPTQSIRIAFDALSCPAACVTR